MQLTHKKYVSFAFGEEGWIQDLVSKLSIPHHLSYLDMQSTETNIGTDDNGTHSIHRERHIGKMATAELGKDDFPKPLLCCRLTRPLPLLILNICGPLSGAKRHVALILGIRLKLEVSMDLLLPRPRENC